MKSALEAQAAAEGLLNLAFPRGYASVLLQCQPVSVRPARARRVFLPGFPGALAGGVLLDRRHVDAEGRAELARARAHEVVVLPGARRFPRAAADPALHADRRRHRGPPRSPAAAHRLAVRPDGDRVRACLARLPGPRAYQLHPAALVRLGARAGVRRTRLSGDDPVARPQEGSAERDRAQLDPVQPRARLRAAARGHRDGGLRRGGVLRAQRPLVLRR